MRYKFIGADSLLPVIALVCGDLDITVADADEDIAVTVESTDESMLSVALDKNSAAITYGGGTSRFLRSLATLNGWLREDKKQGNVREFTHFDTNGSMLDMSRHAVMKVDTVKYVLRKMALMGLNMFMLYTEDTYEIEGRPYFGHMRGRYSHDELRELDSYASTLGI